MLTPHDNLRILARYFDGAGMKPKGFWSYARGDDDHLDGVLTSLRARLEGEISMLLGHDVDIFQDIADLRTGDRWADKLKGELTSAAFLIPVLTPRFFNRKWCREETLTFLKVAEDNGVTPLIFPIRFTEYDRDASCEVQAALKPYQYEDFSGWRFESDPTKKARLEYEFAKDVKAKLKLSKAPATKPAKVAPTASHSAATTEALETREAAPPKAKQVSEELVVDQWPGRGDFTTISAAMKKAKPGARILIRPGTYEENLDLDKPLELIGEGERDEVLVSVDSGNALKVSTSLGLVRNMRFLRSFGKNENVAVLTALGRCVFEDCSFKSHTHAAVHILGASTAPQFLRCRFLDSKYSGAFVREQAEPRFEECTFRSNGLHGIEIIEHAAPDIQRSVMCMNKQSGAVCHDNGRGRFSDCEFSGNGFHGIGVKAQSDPEVHRSFIHENKWAGVFSYENGAGRFHGCEMARNGSDGVTTRESGAPHLDDCRMVENENWGFRAEDADGGGTVENCLLRDNALGPWHFAEGSEGNVIRRNNTEE